MDKGYYKIKTTNGKFQSASQSTIKMDKGYYILNAVATVGNTGCRNPQ